MLEIIATLCFVVDYLLIISSNTFSPQVSTVTVHIYYTWFEASQTRIYLWHQEPRQMMRKTNPSLTLESKLPFVSFSYATLQPEAEVAAEEE